MNNKPSQAPLSLGSSIALVALGTLTVLLLPLIGMQLTDAIHWTLFDFAVAAVLLGATGLLYVALLRSVRQRRQRYLLGGLLALSLLLIWAELAVGLFGSPLAGT
ncbi:hypothetical protein [Massilia sp. CF038]|uniref:hypothetical protein n=1 Tax=Massilia sp. CF038 TaxID=1881045 RepID=UPI0009234E2C|nr:hypothetical protein [Massilia sp. CF038]SHG73147.1 hypothetical protein SAMN05428948_1800 [Massilia sp. CF038]